MLTVMLPALARVPRLQVTVAVPLHPPEAETNDTPAGSVSVTTTLWAVSGPLLVTARLSVN